MLIKSEKQKSIHGLKIRLYRRPITLQDDPPNGPTDYMIWGYYDWASLEWGFFSLNEFFNGVSRNINNQVIHYEEQFVCAYTEKLKNEFIESENPLLVISEIKLDDHLITSIFFPNSRKMLDELGQEIENV